MEIKNIELIREISLALFNDHQQKNGVFKIFPFSPEYTLPDGMVEGSNEHLIFITLTVSIDYMRDAEKLWEQSRDAWLNFETRWIFDPKQVIERKIESLISLFKSIRDRRPIKDAEIWFTICNKLLEFNGDVYSLLEKLKFDAVKISDYIDEDKKDFPYLSGFKIKPLWLRMINDTAGIKLNRIEEIPIPIDVHTARMTLRLVFDEDFDGVITQQLRERIQTAWKLILKDTQIYPIQLDQPLLLLGKYKLLERFMNEHNCRIVEQK